MHIQQGFHARYGRVTVMLVALLALVGSFTSSPARAFTPAALGLSVTSGPPGTHIFINAAGFKAGENVQPIWNYTGPGTGIPQKSFFLYNPSGIADVSGNVLAALWSPTYMAGHYTIAIKGLTSGIVQTFPYTMTSRLDLGIFYGNPGTVLRLTGWGLGAGEAVKVYWNWTSTTSPGTLIQQSTTDKKGSFFNRSYTIPAGTPNGAHTVAAVGQISGAVGQATFTVGNLPVSNTSPPLPSDWANFGYNHQQTRVNPTETTLSATNVGTLAKKWQASPPVASKTVGSPAIANGIAYVGTAQGIVTAYNLAASGSPLWSFYAPGPIYGSPTIANGIAYFGTVQYPNEGVIGNYAFALDAMTGRLLWDTYLPRGGAWVSPVLNNDTVYFTGAQKEGVSGSIIAMNALTGAPVWMLAMPEGIWAPISFDATGANMYVPTGNPCVGVAGDQCAGYLLDLNPASGATVWSYHFADISGDDDCPAAPLYNNGTLYLGCKNGFFYAFNATNGALLWQYDTGGRGDYGIFSSAAISNNLVIFGGGDHRVHALQIANGAVAWTYTTRSLVTSSPSVANGVVYVGGLDGHLYAFNVTTGAVLWNYAAGIPFWASPAIANGVLYEAAGNGNLLAFTLGGV